MTVKNLLPEPKVGQVVGYVMEDGRHQGEVRPAIIVAVMGKDLVNLQVILDGDNDDPIFHNTCGVASMTWRTSRKYSENKEYQTWHYLDN